MITLIFIIRRFPSIFSIKFFSLEIVIYKTSSKCQGKITADEFKQAKKPFIQDYCNRGARLNPALLQEKMGDFLSNEMNQSKSTGRH